MKNKKTFSSSSASSDPLCTPDPAWKSIVAVALAVAKTRLAKHAIPATILRQQQPTVATAIEERPSSVTSMIPDTPPPPAEPPLPFRNSGDPFLPLLSSRPSTPEQGILSPSARDRILAEILRSPSPSSFGDLLRSPSPSSRSR